MIVCARLQYVHAKRCQPAIYLASFCYRHAYFAQLRRRRGTENTLTSIRDVMRSHDIFRNARRKRGGEDNDSAASARTWPDVVGESLRHEIG